MAEHWLGDIALQVSRVLLKMVFKRPSIGDTGEDCTFIVQVAQETELLEWMDGLSKADFGHFALW